MIHSFDTEIAGEYGIPSAIILQQIVDMVHEIDGNGGPYVNGKAWVRRSVKDFAVDMPYLCYDTVKRGLDNLVNKGLIEKSNYSTKLTDRSLWYTLTEKTEQMPSSRPLVQNAPIISANCPNAMVQNAPMGGTLTGQGIEATSTETEVANNATDQDTPYIYNIFLDNKDIVSDKNTDNYTDKNNNTIKNNNVGKPEKPDTSAATRREIIDYLNQKTGARYRDSTLSKKHIIARLNEGYTVEDFKKVIDYKCNEWLGTDMAKYLRPETLFGTKMDGYLGAASVKQTLVGANGIKIDSSLVEDPELTAIFG